MANRLRFDDFRPANVTCEIRYRNATLIYDRTGQIIEDLRQTFTDIAVATASPPQTSFTSREGTFNLEITACRFTAGKYQLGGETFGKHWKTFFDQVIQLLRISVFTRVGLRYMAKKEFATLDEAKAALPAVLTDVLLKPNSRKEQRARAALGKYDKTLLPVYSIKEWKAGPLNSFAYLHDKLATCLAAASASVAVEWQWV